MKRLREAAPPLTHGAWNVPQVARWIRNVIIEFPGILYDELTAATRLGISVEAFRQPSVQNLVAPAYYTGVFSTYKQRWWRDRLFNIAQQLITDHKLRGPIAYNFAEGFKRAFNETLSPAICVYDENPIADWVCYVLKAPAKQEHTIPYYPDSRPQVMDQARVSFRAIAESNDFDISLVDSDSYDLVKQLWGEA